MQKLLDAGLIGRGLVQIDEPSLVKRYNECLDAIGIKPTLLPSFSIDGIGWSPEIATEKDDKYYLSHGTAANPSAILLTPEQYKKPIYFPMHSFERDMMQHAFDNAMNPITEITKDTGIWIEIEQEIDIYNQPNDLLLLDGILLRFHSINGVMEASNRIHQLVRQFISEANAWNDRDIRNEIRDLSKTHGDLRYRSMDIKDYTYNNVQSFYTRACGGLFVLRNSSYNQPLLILDEATHEEVQQHGFQLMGVGNPDLLSQLSKMDLLTFDLDEYYEATADRLKRILMFYFVYAFDQLKHTDHTILEIVASDTLFKKYLSKLYRRKYLVDEVIILENFHKKLRKGKEIDMDGLPSQLQGMLAHPSNHLPPMMEQLIWKILNKRYPVDFMSMYIYDKESFLDRYETWPECVQTYVTHYISEHYEPWMEQ